MNRKKKKTANKRNADIHISEEQLKSQDLYIYDPQVGLLLDILQ